MYSLSAQDISDDMEELMGPAPNVVRFSGTVMAGDNVTVAIDLARRGFLVFPVTRKPDGEWTPIKNWQPKATADPETIAAWWRQHPTARVGLPCGPDNGISVLDVDVKNGKHGDETLRLLLGRDWDALTPVMTHTPSGGRHLFFRHDPRLMNWVEKFGKGLDVRAAGGYVIAPGSWKDGRRYNPLGAPLGSVELPPFPETLIPAPEPQRAPVAVVEATADLRQWARDHLGAKVAELASETEEGSGRNTQVNAIAMWAGGAAAHGFLTREETESALIEACRANGHATKEAQVRALRKTITSGWKAGLRKPISDFPRPLDLTEIEDLPPLESQGEGSELELAEAGGGLLLDKQGQPRKTQSNAIVVMSTLDRVKGLALRRNLLSGRVETRGRTITNRDLTRFRCAIERAGMTTVDDNLSRKAVYEVADRNAYHPIREWLEGLEHDGTERLSGWLPRYMAVEDSVYSRAVGRKFILAMVARVMLPGCKADNMLVLGGAQDLGKSTACHILAGKPEWFSDSLPDISKDGGDPAMKALRGKWLVEVGEMVATRKSEQDSLKAFISRQVDEYRLAYEVEQTSAPRQSVLIGTTNQQEFLRDLTGDRRYWPVWCDGPLDIEGLRADRDQLFAEAMAAFKAGAQWHLTEEESALARVVQREHREPHPWEEVLEEGLRHEAKTTMQDVLWSILGIPRDRQTRAHQTSVASILRSMGWSKKHTDRGNVWLRA